MHEHELAFRRKDVEVFRQIIMNDEILPRAPSWSHLARPTSGPPISSGSAVA